MKKFLKKLIKILFLLFVVSILILASVNIYFKNTLKDRIFGPQNIQTLEHRPTGLILGAGLRKGDIPSSVLADRLEVGYRLLQQNKVDKLILSGDNRTHDHNEPEAMKQYLLRKGIDEENLILDYAGRRTYDSCYRAKKIFSQEKIYIVTQDFHITRAVYLCRSLKIDTIGVSSDLQTYRGHWLNYLRDYLGLTYAVLDINLFQPLPVLGERIEIE